MSRDARTVSAAAVAAALSLAASIDAAAATGRPPVNRPGKGRPSAPTGDAAPAALKTAGFFGAPDASKSFDDIVRQERPYDGRFSWDDYRALVAELVKPRYLVLPLRSYRDAPPAADRVVVGMRHDIDSHPEKALAMARIEKEAHLSSTYFFLHSARYYGRVTGGVVVRHAAVDDMARKLAADGFEVGIHSDLFSMMWRHQFEPASFVREEIEYYRRLGIAVVGAAAHGDGKVLAAGLNNTWIFSEFGRSGTVVRDGRSYRYGICSVADCGLSYEAYLLRRDLATGDIDRRLKGKPVGALISRLAALAPGAKVIILTHPEHWGAERRTR